MPGFASSGRDPFEDVALDHDLGLSKDKRPSKRT
jgi:hypothetical protein